MKRQDDALTTMGEQQRIIYVLVSHSWYIELMVRQNFFVEFILLVTAVPDQQYFQSPL